LACGDGALHYLDVSVRSTSADSYDRHGLKRQGDPHHQPPADPCRTLCDGTSKKKAQSDPEYALKRAIPRPHANRRRKFAAREYRFVFCYGSADRQSKEEKSEIRGVQVGRSSAIGRK